MILAFALLMTALLSQPAAAQTVIAHRGASAELPEHTMVAWERAIELGADYIEQDLQMTADGHLVVLHDATLDRTARGPTELCTGPVRERTLDELRACEVSSWKVEALREAGDTEAAAAVAALSPQNIPTLREVFERFGTDGSVRYYIETKQPYEAPGMESALLSLLREFGLVPASPDDRTVLVQSFSAESLRLLKELEPRIPLVQLLGSNALDGREPAEVAREVADYAVGVGPSRRLVDAGFVGAMQGAGLVVHPWTVNDTGEMRRLLDLGVDGMFTDRPGRLLELLGRR